MPHQSGFGAAFEGPILQSWDPAFSYLEYRKPFIKNAFWARYRTSRFAAPPPIGGFTGRDLNLRSAHP